METGKFAYNANVVWLLSPDNRDKFKTDEEPLLVLDYAKNKLSGFKGIQKLKLIKSKVRLQEEELNSF